jgi:hypothetical protein
MKKKYPTANKEYPIPKEAGVITELKSQRDSVT